MRDRSTCVRWTDTVDELQQAKGAGHIARVLRQSQVRQRVFYVRRFEELQSAVLDEGDISTRKLDLQRIRMMSRSKQNRLFLQVDPGFQVFENFFDDEVGLLILVDERDEPGLLL